MTYKESDALPILFPWCMVWFLYSGKFFTLAILKFCRFQSRGRASTLLTAQPKAQGSAGKVLRVSGTSPPYPVVLTTTAASVTENFTQMD